MCVCVCGGLGRPAAPLWGWRLVPEWDQGVIFFCQAIARPKRRRGTGPGLDFRRLVGTGCRSLRNAAAVGFQGAEENWGRENAKAIGFQEGLERDWPAGWILEGL